MGRGMIERDFSENLIREFLRTAEAAADAARAVTLRHFRSNALRADNKAEAGFDPVTIADHEAEETIRAVIARHRPQDAIRGEEAMTTSGSSGLSWIIDPIDGTRGFISGTPTWGTLIALADGAGPFLGLIDQPFTGERFIGAPGIAELRHGESRTPLKVRQVGGLAEATLFTTFPEIGTPQERAAFDRVAERVRLVRYGMDCYAYALLALGCIDLVIEAGLFAYDVQAPIAVIEAAGGIMTNWQGGPAHEGGQVLAAATPELHAEALRLLEGLPEARG